LVIETLKKGKKKMNLDEFKEAHELHQKWLNDSSKGKRFACHCIFNFEWVEVDFKINLRSAVLRYADLRSAVLRYADLRYADLRYADLRYADLRSADLRSADLCSADLRYADLSSADLRSADLCSADLRYADLSSADLSSADLCSADLCSANLCSANLSSAVLDFSSGISFGCGSFDFRADMRLAAQLAYHFCRIDFGGCKEAMEAQEALVELANKFHKVDECGVLRKERYK
jgi:uncharacterized protein YjbI with pentapeptide repeats